MNYENDYYKRCCYPEDCIEEKNNMENDYEYVCYRIKSHNNCNRRENIKNSRENRCNCDRYEENMYYGERRDNDLDSTKSKRKRCCLFDVFRICK